MAGYQRSTPAEKAQKAAARAQRVAERAAQAARTGNATDEDEAEEQEGNEDATATGANEADGRNVRQRANSSSSPSQSSANNSHQSGGDSPNFTSADGLNPLSGAEQPGGTVTSSTTTTSSASSEASGPSGSSDTNVLGFTAAHVNELFQVFLERLARGTDATRIMDSIAQNGNSNSVLTSSSMETSGTINNNFMGQGGTSGHHNGSAGAAIPASLGESGASLGNQQDRGFSSGLVLSTNDGNSNSVLTSSSVERDVGNY